MSVFKISLPGFTVQTSHIQEEVVDSTYSSPKINTIANPPHVGVIHLNWASSNLIIPQNTVKLLYSFPHGYNYIPSVYGSFSFDNGSTKYQGIMAFQYGALGMIVLDADHTNVNLKYLSFDGLATVSPFILKVKFYVFAERGHE